MKLIFRILFMRHALVAFKSEAIPMAISTWVPTARQWHGPEWAHPNARTRSACLCGHWRVAQNRDDLIINATQMLMNTPGESSKKKHMNPWHLDPWITWLRTAPCRRCSHTWTTWPLRCLPCPGQSSHFYHDTWSLHSRKLTWTLKMMVWKRNFLSTMGIFFVSMLAFGV